MSDMMTTREVADYLRIKERKIYDLVRERRIPCTRVTGKWLFPKALIDLWLLQGSEGPINAEQPAPAIVAGSHDPLLEWALRESGSDLALLPGGSLDGLSRLAKRHAMMCALHVLDEESGEYNIPLVRSALHGQDVVVVGWASRRQGFIVHAGNPKGIETAADLAGDGISVVPRQDGAGAQILLLHLLSQAGIAPDRVAFVAPPARSETDVGTALQEGRADVGLGLESVAKQFKLDFVPVQDEQLDLVMRRRVYFDRPVQDLFAFARGPAFRKRADALGGYDITSLGVVRYNAP